MTNFEKLAASAKPLFLHYDQEDICRRFGLKADERRLFLNFCGESYAVDRRTGDITSASGRLADPAAVLSIFDMLCCPSAPGPLSGEWRTTNTLPGGVQNGGPSAANLLDGRAAAFAARLPALRRACEALGGKSFPVGDVSYMLPIFDWFPAVFQFWNGDDEFPPSVRFLWDRDTLRYLRFETLFYIMDFLLRRLDSLAA